MQSTSSLWYINYSERHHIWLLKNKKHHFTGIYQYKVPYMYLKLFGVPNHYETLGRNASILIYQNRSWSLMLLTYRGINNYKWTFTNLIKQESKNTAK